MKVCYPESAISHCSSNHDTELLQHRQLVLCPDSGHMKYQTKLHEGLIPRQLHVVGKVIQVRNEEVFVYDSKLKKKKLNKNIIMCSFKSSGDIQKKEGGPDSCLG